MRPTLNKIKQLVDTLSNKIQVPINLLPTYGNSREGHPNIEIGINGQLYYEIYERGQQIKSDLAFNVDHLCYLIFLDIKQSMASKFELNNRIEKQDLRIILFEKQVELLGQLNEDWKVRCEQQQKQILSLYPFRKKE